MPLRLTLLAISACATALVVAPAWVQAAPEITLTRLDCGTPRGAVADLGFSFSDTFGDSVPNIRLVFSCYLIKHGNDYMLWDTGWGMSAAPFRLPSAVSRLPRPSLALTKGCAGS